MNEIALYISITAAIVQIFMAVGTVIWAVLQIKSTNGSLKQTLERVQETMHEITTEQKKLYERDVSQEARLKVLENTIIPHIAKGVKLPDDT